MPKMKTRKAVARRFKVTAKGKLIRHSPGKSHLLAKKSSKRKRRIGKAKLVDDGQVVTYLMYMGKRRKRRKLERRPITSIAEKNQAKASDKE
jgi:large subunit ribosomal protein L35